MTYYLWGVGLVLGDGSYSVQAFPTRKEAEAVLAVHRRFQTHQYGLCRMPLISILGAMRGKWEIVEDEVTG